DVDAGERRRHVVLVGGRPPRVPARVRRAGPVRDRAGRDRRGPGGAHPDLSRRRRARVSACRRAGARDVPPALVPDGSRQVGDRPDVRENPMIYDDLRVVDLTEGIAGAYCAKLLTDLGADVVFTTPVAGPLFTYLRTSQRHAGDAAPWLASADLVIVGEPGRAPAG